MARSPARRPAWKRLLARKSPLLLPAAHDALTARLIERAHFKAYQVGGFATDAARHGFPDIDLTHYAEKHAAAREIIAASSLPVLVDCDDGYGDVKNVTRVVQGYEKIGASALFIEDQKAPKRCGHMRGKEVVPAELMVQKVRAAAAARLHPETFLLARTDALAAGGVDEAVRRAERYLKAGADGAYVEGPRSVEELEQVGRALKGAPLATSILEGGGKTPWVAPKDLYAMGFTMILYPSSVIFRAAHAIERALEDLLAGRPMPPEESVGMERFEEILGMPRWEEIEERFAKQ